MKNFFKKQKIGKVKYDFLGLDEDNITLIPLNRDSRALYENALFNIDTKVWEVGGNRVLKPTKITEDKTLLLKTAKVHNKSTYVVELDEVIRTGNRITDTNKIQLFLELSKEEFKTLKSSIQKPIVGWSNISVILVTGSTIVGGFCQPLIEKLWDLIFAYFCF